MRKQELQSLVAWVKIQSKKDLAVYTIVGIDLEQGKVILDNGKLYTMGTIQRWYSLYEEEIPQVVEPLVEQQDNTEEQTNTSDLQGNTNEDDQLHDQHDTTTKIEVLEGNTATTNTTTPQGTTQQDNLIQSLNNLLDLHNVQMEAKKQYIKVTMEGKRGALCMIRQTKDTGFHIDFKSKVLAKLDDNYRSMLIEKYNCHIYDKTRGYFRIFDCNDTQVLETIILTAKQVG